MERRRAHPAAWPHRADGPDHRLRHHLRVAHPPRPLPPERGRRGLRRTGRIVPPAGDERQLRRRRTGPEHARHRGDLVYPRSLSVFPSPSFPRTTGFFSSALFLYPQKNMSRKPRLPLLAAILLASSAFADAPLQRFSSADPYYIYYGAWNASLVSAVKANDYRLVIVEPRYITRAQVAEIQRGADDTAGTADDVRVVGYISFGEDNRPSIYAPGGGIAPVPGGAGPRIDPRYDPVTGQTVGGIVSTLNPDGSASLGNPSPGGAGHASF